MDMYEKKCSGPEKQGVCSGFVSGAGFGFSFVALYCMTAFCFYIGVVLVQHDITTFQEVFKLQHQPLNQLNVLNIYFDAYFDILMRDFMQVFCIASSLLSIFVALGSFLSTLDFNMEENSKKAPLTLVIVFVRSITLAVRPHLILTTPLKTSMLL